MGEPGERAGGGADAGDERGMWDAGGGMRGVHAPIPYQGARMNRRGFALLAVLWTLTAVTVLAGTAITAARLGSTTTRNRVLLARAAWAREACAEILQARYAQDPSVREVDTVDLGRGTWCTAALDDPSAKLNLNVADRATLVTVVRSVGHRPTGG